MITLALLMQELDSTKNVSLANSKLGSFEVSGGYYTAQLQCLRKLIVASKAESLMKTATTRQHLLPKWGN
jgi:hypothetical protein